MRPLLTPAWTSALAAAALGLAASGWHSPLRAAIVALFAVAAPGWAILDPFDLADGFAGAGMAISTSVALATVVPTVLIYAHHWSPLLALAILAAITWVAAVVAIVVRRRAPG